MSCDKVLGTMVAPMRVRIPDTYPYRVYPYAYREIFGTYREVSGTYPGTRIPIRVRTLRIPTCIAKFSGRIVQPCRDVCKICFKVPFLFL